MITAPSIWTEKSSNRKVKVYKIYENGVILHEGLDTKNDGCWGGSSPTLENFLKHFIQPTNVQLDLFEATA